jgi:hypothetical protein
LLAVGFERLFVIKLTKGKFYRKVPATVGRKSLPVKNIVIKKPLLFESRVVLY